MDMFDEFIGGMRVLMVFAVLSLAVSEVVAQEQEGMIRMDTGLENLYEQEQRAWALKVELAQQDYGLIENLFFENDIVKIYNYTAYDVGAAQHKFLSGQTELIGLQDFSISLGYGMEFRVHDDHSIGYEYLSNFPYDRGQMIRVFWNYLF